MDDTLADLQAEIDTARATYVTERTGLRELLVPLFQDAEEACHTLISGADEFGLEQAREMLDRPVIFGQFHDAAIDIDPERRTAIEVQLDRVIEGHDRLDIVTARREGYLQARDPQHQRVINFDGREWVVDADGRELRAADNTNERISLVDAVEVAERPAEPTLTERLHVDANVPLAQPGRDRDRTRGR